MLFSIGLENVTWSTIFSRGGLDNILNNVSHRSLQEAYACEITGFNRIAGYGADRIRAEGEKLSGPIERVPDADGLDVEHVALRRRRLRRPHLPLD